MKNLFLCAFIFAATQLFGQNLVPTSGNNTFTVCSGILYDSGGPFGSYTNNANGYTVLNPSTAGNMIQLSGTFNGDNCCDYLYIYNGVGLTGNLLWSGYVSGAIPTITSTDGALTVKFVSDVSTVGSGFALDIACVPPVNFTVPSTGNNTYTVCSGILYDSGGPAADYSNNSNGYSILYPSNPGNMVRVSGSAAGENCCDFIRIYNGAGLGGILLWAGNPGVNVIPAITSTSGPLTVEFTSNGNTVGTGFALDIICLPPQLMSIPTSGNISYIVCSGVLYDSGGPFGSYTNNSNGYTVLNPSNPGNMIQVSGTFAGDNCCDLLYIYNGVGLTGNLLWSGYASGAIPTITSTTGSLTVKFVSDGSSVGNGFAMDINCVPPVNFTLPVTGNNNYTVCSGVLYDSGGPNGDYSNNSDGYTILYPSNPGNMIMVSGSSNGENCCDTIKIYNGAGLGGNLLWAGTAGIGTIPAITSTAGPLTIKFTSNSSNTGTGFALDIICLPPQLLSIPTSGSISYIVCSGVLYDSGGPFGSYTNNSNGYTVLNPSNPGNMIQIGGTFTGDNCCDYLYIYNGVGLSGNLLWSGSVSGTIPNITSTDGPLTVKFVSDGSSVGAGYALDINCVPPVNFMVPSSGNNSYTVCSGILYDSGGPNGNYSNNSNGYTVLYPSNPGNMVRVSGTSAGENCCDFIKIYNGAGLGGILLWAGNPGTGTIPSITSTAGPLTIEFTSNATNVGTGFMLDIICMPPQLMSIPTSGNISYIVCSGVLYDSGGPFGSYTNNANGYTVLNPSNPGNMIQVSGTYTGDNCCDYLYIYNGVGVAGNLLWSGSLSGAIPTITSTDGPLTIKFVSDVSTVGPGFALDINCVPPVDFTVPNTGNNSYTVCSGVLYDSGGPNADYSNNSNGYTVLYPSNPGNMIRVSGTSAGDNCCDFIRIYNGAGLGGNLLWAGNPAVGIIPSITSTAGPLTIEFTSNGTTVGSGFALDIICMPPELFSVPTTGNNTYILCSGVLYDAGGPFGSYTNNQNGYTILNPSNPGNLMQISGTFTGDNCCDYLYVYNGAGLGGNLLWSGNLSGTVPTITSTTGPLTVKFVSDVSSVGSGFALDINCVNGPNCVPTIFISSDAGTSICQNQQVTFTAAITNGGSSPTYVWKRNGVIVSTSSNYLSSNINNGDVITCELTSNAACATVPVVTSNTLTMTVNLAVTPSFTQVPPICAGSSIAPLPTTSNNSIEGTWLPALNNNATTTYTFTPNAGQCGTTATMTITVNATTTPTFTQVPAICSGSTLSPLPTTSNNGIAGTWTPALNNSITTNYTFTPNAGQCGTTAFMTIVVNQSVTPSFTQVPAICTGDALASLPATSNNGIAGSWAPAMNNLATTTYTFTPNSGQCINNATMTIDVNPIITPTFIQDGPFCAGQVIAPLPSTSLEGISGTWTPAIDNTQTTNYTFTANAGQCANNTNMLITLNQNPSVTLQQNGINLLANSGYSNYEWTFNGSIISGANTNQITADVIGLYAVTVTDVNGCTGTASFDVLTVGVNEINFSNHFSIAPNPSYGKTKLSIELLNEEQIKIIVMDLQGKELIQKAQICKAGRSEIQLDLSELANGTYYIQIENAAKKQTKRVVKM